MKNRFTLLLVVSALFALLLAGCGGNGEAEEAPSADQNGSEESAERADTTDSPEADAADDEVYKMKLGHANPPGDPKDVAANYFADLVNERADGRIEVEVYAGGTLGDWRELVEGLSLGQNEIVIESIGTMNAYSDFANIDAVPYIYRDFDHFTDRK